MTTLARHSCGGVSSYPPYHKVVFFGATVPDSRETVAMLTRGFLAVATGCSLCSCGSAAPEADQVSVRDSAGVEIVETVAGGGADNAWRLVDPAILTLGGPESGDWEGLFRVTSARRLSDGSVVVANSGTSELKFYGSGGRFLHKSGREGRGPGEFTGLAHILRLPPDSLLAYDGRLSRISIFSEAGHYARTFRLDFDPIVVPVDVLPDGAILANNVRPLTGMSDGLNVDSALVLRFGLTGELLDSLGRFAHNWRYSRERENGIRTTLGVPFAPLGQIVTREDGYCYGSAEMYAIRCADARGVLQRIIRLERDPAPVTEQMVEQYFAAALETDNANRRRALERLMRELPIPDHLPAFAAMLGDAEGNLWIQDYPRPGDEAEPSSWRVFGPDGRPLGSIEMPGRFSPLEIGSDYVLGRWRDRQDVEYVQMYCLAKPDAAGQVCGPAT